MPLFEESGVLLGVIVLEHTTFAKFSAEDRRFVEALGLQALIVLNTIDVYDQLERQIRPQRALTTIATRIQDTTHSLETALSLLLTGITAKQGIGFSRAMLLTFNEAGTELRGRVAIGALTLAEAELVWQNIDHKLQGIPPKKILLTLLDEAEQAGRDLGARRGSTPLTDRIRQISFTHDSLSGAIRTAVHKSQIQQVTSGEADPWRGLLATDDETSPYTFVCCPLIWQKEKIGILVVDDRFLLFEREHVEASRIAGLESFAEMISLVILNARLRDRSQAEAFRDLEHQIRSPLRTASGIVTELARSAGPRKGNDVALLERVLAKVTRVSRSLRLYAELVGRQPIHLRVLHRLSAPAVFDMLSSAISEGELQRDDLEVRVDDLSLFAFEAVPVEFDLVLLEQVFGNVFDNVFKYSIGRTQVWVWAERDDGGVTLRVENTALLTESDAQQSTIRGFRGEVAQEVTGEGSGLGMWIVDNIMQAHRGSARLRVAGGNTVFTEIFFTEAGSNADSNR